MMAMTTKSSISVKPDRCLFMTESPRDSGSIKQISYSTTRAGGIARVPTEAALPDGRLNQMTR
jgi:hypothetical protein